MNAWTKNVAPAKHPHPGPRTAVRVHQFGSRQRRRLDHDAHPVTEAGPARRFAALDAATELAASRLMEQRLGLVREAYATAKAHRLRQRAEYCTAAGLLGTLLTARHSRALSIISGLALLTGSLLQRFGIFEAGVESTKDPRYVVVPQRQRLQDGSAPRYRLAHTVGRINRQLLAPLFGYRRQHR